MHPRIENIIHNTDAADALPMRIAVAAILFSIIFLLASNVIADMISDSHEYEAGIEVSKIITHARHMSSAGPGSKVILELDIPSDTMIVMGSLPDEEAAWPHDSNNYYIQTGTRRSIHRTNVFFSNLAEDGPAIITPGLHEVVIESVREPDHEWILIKVYETTEDQRL